MKTNDRLRKRLTFRNRLLFVTLAVLAIGEGWLLASTWSVWEQCTAPIQGQTSTCTVPAGAYPLP